MQAENFTYENSMFQYEMKGELDPKVVKSRKEAEIKRENSPPEEKSPVFQIEQFRSFQKNFVENTQDKDPINISYVKQSTVSEDMIEFNSEKQVKFYIHESCKKSNEKTSCVVYVHGGGGIGFSAQDYKSACSRIAVDNHTKVFNIDYTVAPEANISEIVDQVCCLVEHVHMNHQKYEIDPDRIVVTGDSAGGSLCVSSCMKLAEQGKKSLVKLCLPLQASVGDVVQRNPKEKLVNVLEKEYVGKKQLFVRSLAQIDEKDPDYQQKMDNLVGNAQLFPIYIKDDLAKEMPKTIIFTSEFDYNKRDCENFARTLQRNGSLQEFCCHAQGTHGYYLAMSNPISEMFWSDIKKVFTKFVL